MQHNFPVPAQIGSPTLLHHGNRSYICFLQLQKLSMNMKKMRPFFLHFHHLEELFGFFLPVAVPEEDIPRLGFISDSESESKGLGFDKAGSEERCLAPLDTGILVVSDSSKEVIGTDSGTKDFSDPSQLWSPFFLYLPTQSEGNQWILAIRQREIWIIIM